MSFSNNNSSLIEDKRVEKADSDDHTPKKKEAAFDSAESVVSVLSKIALALIGSVVLAIVLSRYSSSMLYLFGVDKATMSKIFEPNLTEAPSVAKKTKGPCGKKNAEPSETSSLFGGGGEQLHHSRHQTQRTQRGGSGGDNTNMWYSTGDHSLFKIFSENLDGTIKYIDEFLECAKQNRKDAEGWKKLIAVPLYIVILLLTYIIMVPVFFCGSIIKETWKLIVEKIGYIFRSTTVQTDDQTLQSYSGKMSVLTKLFLVLIPFFLAKGNIFTAVLILMIPCVLLGAWGVGKALFNPKIFNDDIMKGLSILFFLIFGIFYILVGAVSGISIGFVYLVLLPLLFPFSKGESGKVTNIMKKSGIISLLTSMLFIAQLLFMDGIPDSVRVPCSLLAGGVGLACFFLF